MEGLKERFRISEAFSFLFLQIKFKFFFSRRDTLTSRASHEFNVADNFTGVFSYFDSLYESSGVLKVF